MNCPWQYWVSMIVTYHSINKTDSELHISSHVNQQTTLKFMTELSSAGTLTKLRNAHFAPPPPTPPEGVKGLELSNVGGMFVMLFAGALIGVFIGIGEFILNVCNEKTDDETFCQRMGKECQLATTCAG